MTATEQPVWLFIFVLANLTIALAYLWLALAVLPSIPVKLTRTKIGGVGFFLLCGLTHAVMAISSILHPGMSMSEMATSWYSLAIHIPQAIAVWMFVTGLYIEIAHWGFVPHTPESDLDAPKSDLDT